MVDADESVRRHLAGNAEVIGLFGQRLFAGSNLPSGIRIEDGPALLFSARGGSQSFSSKHHEPSFQFRAYAKNEALARQASRVLYDALNDKPSREIKSARLEGYPALLREPETQWPFMLSFYRVGLANS